ncbi:FdhF/YdeP family oxidoreductase [Verrucomicrobiaceae bacterium 5K15]|uniref:FdhF/YdeP family oxidoreductase n=1 Tax=Oceaniferula flava TaxID=2800421 RepID=A0AAE2SDW4_9BACT|nr:FdhF/YdeP family oxidoreductase [Oceaniferula flavus]MBK1855099.1 FdhF/YdeP family oxidoreductase [Oceaniferula flavus]MBM1136405.1 FdhF/YdeP family oxidoreductase [Oceaniferula flavus]
MASDDSKHSLDEGEPPHEDKAPKVGKPKTSAAGATAVVSSMNHVMRTAGPVRGTKALLDLNQTDGFDCPSCAWPDPDDHRAQTEFCENGAKAIASEATTRQIDRSFFKKHSIDELLEQSDYWHDQQGRLTEPMVLREGSSHYEPISWDDAFALIGKELNKLETPDDGIFYTSGRASNEAAFLYQAFIRHFGTNNLPDCSNMCHESSGTAMGQAVGVGKGTVTLDDLHEAETIICIGQNPGTNHPRMLASLEKCVENGGKIIAVNPLKEAGLMGFAHPQKISGMLGKSTPLASQYLQVKVNGDLALLRGLGKEFFERGALDEKFIAEHTQGIDAYRTRCEAVTWENITEKCGIAKEEIQQLADTILRGERKLVTCWAMGLTQHRNAVATIREVCNLHMMLGAIGRLGAGLCPVRGHSNVQGDRTVGIFEKMPAWFHDAMDREFGITTNREHGYDTVEAILAMHREPGKVFIALGGNFLQASPDTSFTAKALQNCSLTVHISTKLNRSHLVHGKTALILPCLGRSERDTQKSGDQFVTCENSMGIVHMSKGKLTPSSPELLSEPAIIAGIAEATVGNTEKTKWRWLVEDYDRIRDLIEKVIPGFAPYNQQVRHPGGFYLPNTAKQRVWKTASGKAEFSDSLLEQFEPADGRLGLQTLRSHDQYNTTVYGLNDRYRGIGTGRRIIFLNPDDMKERGISPVSLVDIISHWEDGERTAEEFYAIPYDMPAGSAAAYFPEANVLVPVESTALESNTPTSKGIEITVKPSA